MVQHYTSVNKILPQQPMLLDNKLFSSGTENKSETIVPLLQLASIPEYSSNNEFENERFSGANCEIQERRCTD